jgi:hypothetical protein
MSKYANVKIPMLLLSQMIGLLEHWDLTGYDAAIKHDFNTVYFALLSKMQSIELREAYAKIIYAKDDDARDAARIEYLRRKQLRDRGY